MKEWTVYDSKQEKFKLVKAQNQKEAIKKSAVEHSVIPREHTAARPRMGDHTVMEESEFDNFMEKIKK